MTILFICTGNTCRSPLAAALASQASEQADLRFQSAGLQALPGLPASEGSQVVAAEHGISLVDHRSRSINQAMHQDVDWVIGMTRSHVAMFKARFPIFPGRIGLLGEPGLDLAQRATPDAMQINDPYGGHLAEYRAMAEQVGRLVRAWLPFFQADEGNLSDTPKRPEEEAS